MRLATAVMLASAVAGRSAPVTAQPAEEPWWGPDKALHFGLSAAIAAGGYGVGVAAFDGHTGGALVLGAGLSLGAGFAKETLDAAGLGTPSYKDLLWDVLGTTVGLGVALVVHQIVLGVTD